MVGDGEFGKEISYFECIQTGCPFIILSEESFVIFLGGAAVHCDQMLFEDHRRLYIESIVNKPAMMVMAVIID